MLPPSFYNSDNVRRLKYARVTTAVLAGLLCVYMAASALLGVREVRSAESLLRRGKAESANLSREAVHEKRQEARQRAPGDGGVDAFAVTLSGWARERRVQVESYIPEGSPAATQVTVGGSDLGVWNASRVRIRGKGSYAGLMGLMDELRSPGLPVKLESFALQAGRSGSRSAITFDLVLMVFERKPGAAS